MVATGAGVTLLPALAVHGAYGAAKGLAIRPFAKPVPSRQIGAVWRTPEPLEPVRRQRRALG